jgi:hypothetical protein
MKWIYTPENAWRGALIYGLGDAAAGALLGQFTWLRLLGVALVGGTLYALEVPNYFRWIDGKMGPATHWRQALLRAGMAMLYFNPLWIARHLLLLALLSGGAVGWHLLAVGAKSFLANIPLSLLANWLIQNRIPLSWRFVASALFSGLMAIYYALSAVWFG